MNLAAFYVAAHLHFLLHCTIIVMSGETLLRRTAALLGRFLPRLGPFANADGPLFFQSGRGSRHIDCNLCKVLLSRRRRAV